MRDVIRKADILVEALPYIQAFAGKTIVVKYGGSAMEDQSVVRGILQDLVFFSAVGLRPVLLHGGGPLISRRMASRGRSATFIRGMRVTDCSMVRLVNTALEEVNAQLVRHIRALGGRAVGLVARHQVIVATPHRNARQLGFVGVVKTVRTDRIRQALNREIIPIVSPIGSVNGQLYNINADDVASAVAASLHAEKLVLLTNVRGIFRPAGGSTSLVSTVSIRETQRLIRRKVIQQGMIPKVRACVAALKRGVKKTHIIDANLPHALLLEIFTKQGIGTEIVR